VTINSATLQIALISRFKISFHPAPEKAYSLERVQKRIQDVIDPLSAHPEIGIRTDNATIRRLPTPPYPFLVFYEVTEKEIIIHAAITPLAILPGCQGPRSQPKPRKPSP
jgi:plasmid stabilization system protein ParE